MTNGCNSLSWTFSLFLLGVSIDTNSSFIWATPLRGEATRHVITHLLACFAIMKTPSLITTDNGPAYISRHSTYYIKHITNIPSVHFSYSVVSDSLWPHELKHARSPCPSPTPRVHSNSCPSSQWCHPAISSSVIPFSSCPQSLPALESFPMS